MDLHAQGDKGWQIHLHEMEGLEADELARSIVAAMG